MLGQDILVAPSDSRNNLLRVAERIDNDGVVRGEAKEKRTAPSTHSFFQDPWLGEKRPCMPPVRVRQCCDEEANGERLTALDLLMGLQRARGVGNLGLGLCTGTAMSDFLPCMAV